MSRAPGTLHVAPHSARHSFDFSKVNVSHHIDHLSFGLELPAKARARLPAEVQSKLLHLDGREFAALENHQTLEVRVRVKVRVRVRVRVRVTSSEEDEAS